MEKWEKHPSGDIRVTENGTILWTWWDATKRAVKKKMGSIRYRYFITRVTRRIKAPCYKIKLWKDTRGRRWNCECCGRKNVKGICYYVERKDICGDCNVYYIKNKKLNPYYLNN